jgi:hypothetical protein
LDIPGAAAAWRVLPGLPAQTYCYGFINIESRDQREPGQFGHWFPQNRTVVGGLRAAVTDRDPNIRRIPAKLSADLKEMNTGKK